MLGPSECWPWKGCVNHLGYGGLKVGGKMRRSHRLAWELTYGPIPHGEGYHGMCVLHRCDNPPCVNPSHLWLGSQQDNIADRDAKGHHWSITKPEASCRGDRNGSRRHPERMRRGESHPRAHLTDSGVREIRQALAAGEQQASIAARYGVGRAAITKINSGKRWRHIQ